VGWTMTSTNQ
jgi:hypothetical protein